MPVSVRWGSHSFSFQLPRTDTLVAAVRQSIAAYTGLHPDAFDIVHDGAVLADDAQPISAYHLRPNSILALVAHADTAPTVSPSEGAQIAAIAAELAAVSTELEPAHAAFLTQLAAQPRPALAKEHARLAELLLQALLRVDGITPEHDWAAARADRRAAVNRIQRLLDQLDAAWGAAR